MERREKVNACRELARRSGQNISFDPQRWGENMLDSMEAGLQKFLSQLPEEVRDDYEDKYIAKYSEWLGAMSRCFSQAITGAGGWNAAVFRRHERTQAAEKAAYERLEAWCEKVIKRCNRQERLTGWAEVERLQEKLDGLTRLQETMKAANKIIRSKKLAEVEKVDELVALGLSESTALKLMEPDFCGRIGFATFQLSNNLLTFLSDGCCLGLNLQPFKISELVVLRDASHIEVTALLICLQHSTVIIVGNFHCFLVNVVVYLIRVNFVILVKEPSERYSSLCSAEFFLLSSC